MDCTVYNNVVLTNSQTNLNVYATILKTLFNKLIQQHAYVIVKMDILAQIIVIITVLSVSQIQLK